MQRITFECPAEHYVRLYTAGGQTGGAGSTSLPTFSGHIGHQRGYGFLSFLSRTVVPLMQRFVLPHALRFGTNVLSDLSSGNVSARSSLKTHGISAAKALGRDVLEHGLSGSGRRSQKEKTTPSKKKKKKKKKKKPKGKMTKSELMRAASLAFAPISSQPKRHALVGGRIVSHTGTSKKAASQKKKKGHQLSKSAQLSLALSRKFPQLS